MIEFEKSSGIESFRNDGGIGFRMPGANDLKSIA
jgi:hypothetical protein